MAKPASWIVLSLALLVALVAVGWPSIERQLAASGVGCPWPFSLFHVPKAPPTGGDAQGNTAGEGLRRYTVAELRDYDGSTPGRPILLAIGGKVVDVTSGEKFYGVGKTYHQFAGTACTRALVLSSLDADDISDDISDFTDEQRQEMEETKRFYYDKYPIVGELVV